MAIEDKNTENDKNELKESEEVIELRKELEWVTKKNEEEERNLRTLKEEKERIDRIREIEEQRKIKEKQLLENLRKEMEKQKKRNEEIERRKNEFERIGEGRLNEDDKGSKMAREPRKLIAPPIGFPPIDINREIHLGERISKTLDGNEIKLTFDDKDKVIEMEKVLVVNK